MKKQVLFIQGGGEGAYEEDGKLAAYLRDALGDTYDLHYPQMPNEEAPEYEAWKAQIAESLAALDGEVILVGHSLGGSLLLKFLAEETSAKSVAGLFIISAPYWRAEDWQVDDYMLPEAFATKLKVPQMFLYQSRDDEWVPFAHLGLYAEKLPQAVIREFDGRGHQFNNDLSEVVGDIKSL